MSSNQIENKRLAAYKDPEIARFLIKLIELSGKLTPEYNADQKYVYSEAEKFLSKNSAETVNFLEDLSGLKLLDKQVFDMTLNCPSCSGANISTKYICPHCGSFQIIRNALIEHLVCGYINNLPKFIVNNELVCPKCKGPVNSKNSRSAGRWYDCASCGKRIENLQTMHHCRQCGEKFDFDQSKYLEAYTYTISKVAKDEINSGVLFSAMIERVFTDIGYSVQLHGKIVGTSGIEQQFDVIIKTKTGELIAIDNLLSNVPVDQQLIIKEYGKIFDAKTKTYIIANSLTEDAKKLAKSYNLEIIETGTSSPINALKIIGSKLGEKKIPALENVPAPKIQQKT